MSPVCDKEELENIGEILFYNYLCPVEFIYLVLTVSRCDEGMMK